VSGIVTTLENSSFLELENAVRHQMEGALRLVFGTKLRTVQTLEMSLHEPVSSSRNEILLVPLIVPKFESDALKIFRTLQSHTPFQRPFGLEFLLIGGRGFSPESLHDGFWPETLDGLYERGIPSGITLWFKGLASVEGFQLSANISSMFRELDSLQELRAFGKTLSELETKMENLSENLSENFPENLSESVVKR
jgi:hypothetical protein